MRSILIGIAISGLLIGAGQAQAHRLVPGTDQIVAPTPTYFPTPPSPPLTQAGLQSGIAGNADGSNDFPRAHPDPGSLPPGWQSVQHAATGSASPVSAIVPDVPASWKGSLQDWTLHSHACAAMYNTYDPSTDRWTRPSGATNLCPASMGLHG
jgi:hypothetical protein